MAKILIWGDAHFHPFSQFATIDPSTGLNSRFKASLDLLYWIIDQAKEVDYVVQLGDIYESRTKLDPAVVALTVEAFKEFSKPVFVLVGNHDIWGSNASETTLRCLPPNIDVITNPRDIYLPEAHITIGMHPYTHDIAAFKKWSARSHDLDLVCFHQGLNEGRVGAYNATLDCNLSIKDLPDARMRWGGHYHLHQDVGDGRTFYAGSIFQCNFSERDEQKMIHILDTQTWDFTSIPTEAPTFHLYQTLAAAKAGKHKDCDFLRIVVTPKEVDQAKAEFPKAQLDVQKTLTKERRVIDDKAVSSDQDLLKGYLAEKKPELNEEKLLRLGLELLGPD